MAPIMSGILPPAVVERLRQRGQRRGVLLRRPGRGRARTAATAGPRSCARPWPAPSFFISSMASAAGPSTLVPGDLRPGVDRLAGDVHGPELSEPVVDLEGEAQRIELRVAAGAGGSLRCCMDRSWAVSLGSMLVSLASTPGGGGGIGVHSSASRTSLPRRMNEVRSSWAIADHDARRGSSGRCAAWDPGPPWSRRWRRRRPGGVRPYSVVQRAAEVRVAGGQQGLDPAVALEHHALDEALDLLFLGGLQGRRSRRRTASGSFSAERSSSISIHWSWK